MQTPGGGGYGKIDGQVNDEPHTKKRRVGKDGSSMTKVGTGSIFNYKRSQESA